MIDNVNRTDHPQDNAPEMATNPADHTRENNDVEELREEDAAVNIDFEGNQAPSVEAQSTAAPDGAEAIAEAVDQSESTEGIDYPAIVADLERQLATLKAQFEDRNGQYARIAADFDNYRKRTSKEKEDLEVQIKCNTISELLPVVDNFERARSQIKPQTDQEMTIHKSYQSVYKQLVECLKRLGVSAMRAEGQEFDPTLHEAVMREPTDQYPEGTIMEELVRGYLLGERVLRHAMVKVATAPEPNTPSTEEVESAPED
ncbi:Nucleotide exchange factor GrpE [Halomicronema hongdechloris C2206]|uniref:Protein GrpE n=1 Tax=Halomicronema hongdechloris C2206 TaxID=1641165 RepID=A0A1Z3HI23_9CYAN|nr:nucleotide exchange factor GrpE [Halomicronema hongdechloris]ASC69946.1 Nucleotide exchange factor GrpE [Halomicronema hongdechloris C2206]